MSEALKFDDVRQEILDAAEGAGLHAYAERVLLDLSNLDRALELCLVLEGWEPPHEHHAAIKLDYSAKQTALADEGDEPGEEADELDTLLEIEIAYQLVGPISRLPLKDLARHVEPLAAKINKALGGEPRQVYYTVSAGHPKTGEAHVFEAKVEDLHRTSVLSDDFDFATLMEGIAVALKAVGPA
jgi:hypothetical protein